jgi:hypothetical protein
MASDLLSRGGMNALTTALEKFVADPRVRIAGPVLAALLVVGFLTLGTVSRTSTRAVSKPVSVLPERPLDIPLMGRQETVSGVDAILAWQKPAPKPAPTKAKPASPKARASDGTLTARR